MRSKFAKHVGWTSHASPVAPVLSTPAFSADVTTTSPAWSAKTTDPGPSKKESSSNKYSKSSVPNPKALSSSGVGLNDSPEPESEKGCKFENEESWFQRGYEGVVKLEVAALRQGLSTVKQDLAVAVDRLRDLEGTSVRRGKWEEATTNRLQELQSGIAAASKSWKQDADMLSDKIAEAQVKSEQSASKDIDKLNTQVQRQFKAVDASLSHHRLEAVTEREVFQKEIDAKCNGISSALAATVTQEHLKELQATKAWEDLFKGLEYRMENTITRISNEHHQLRKMHSTYFQDSQDAMASVLRAEIDQLSSELGAKLDDLQVSRPSVAGVEEMLQAALSQEAGDRCKAQDELRGSLEENLGTLKESVGDLGARLAADAQRRSDERQQDKVTLQRQMHHCMSLILPSMSTEPCAENYPREESEFPSTWVN